MLIRNAVIDGYPGPVDLRLMHGTVQEIGVGLQKGLYESEMDVQGGLPDCLYAGCPIAGAHPQADRKYAALRPYPSWNTRAAGALAGRRNHRRAR